MPFRMQFCLCLVTTLLAVPTRLPASEPVQPVASAPVGRRINPEIADPSGEVCPVGQVEPDPTTHRLGLAGLGLMAGVLGVIWGRHHSVRRQRRRRSQDDRPHARFRDYIGLTPDGKLRRTLPRQRIRRFDYDRFYLRMLRDL